jgi:hypothetical protein
VPPRGRHLARSRRRLLRPRRQVRQKATTGSTFGLEKEALMTTNPVTNPAATTSGATGTGTSSAAGSAGNVDSMFMQLLITQLQNQDPLSPMDPSAFVQQLAQVTSLDQLTQINQLLQNTLGGTTTSSSGGD